MAIFYDTPNPDNPAHKGKTFILDFSTKNLDIDQVQTILGKVSKDLHLIGALLNIIRRGGVSFHVGVVSRWDDRHYYAFLACQEAVNSLAGKIEVMKREVRAIEADCCHAWKGLLESL
ncbi:MAG: hypothetical protein Q9184_002046 [Pyrenodesmia sp. 2 TL-2023]